jgi:hypothetical protein
MTIALAQAFKIAVPSSLSRPGNVNEQPEYNPLQPSGPVPGTTSYPTIRTASPGVAIQPSSTGYPETQSSSPAHLHTVMGDQLLQSPPSVSSATPPERPNRPRRILYFALIACVVVLLVGLGAFAALRLFSQQNAQNSQKAAVSVVGHITFLASPNAAHSTYDQLQISLTSISSPPAGKTYYAWLENAAVEANHIQNWPLQVTNGTVKGTYLSDAQHSDLLDNNTLFLITEEDSGSTPVIPSPGLNARLYYAVISHLTSSNPTYEVKQCPTGGTSNGTNPCS